MLGPRQKRDDRLRVYDKLLELEGLLLVDDSDPTFVVCTSVLRVDISLNPTHIAFDDRSLVFDPSALGVLVDRDRSSLIRLDILLQHEGLSIICHVW